MSRYDTNTKGQSPVLSQIYSEFERMPRDSFDNTHTVNIDVQPYAITPIRVFEMLPNSDVDVSFDVSLQSVNPSVRRLLNSCRVEVRVYRRNYNDCWEAWNNFITKARSGQFETSIPYVDFTLASETHHTSLPYNPAFTLGLAPNVRVGGSGMNDVTRLSYSANRGVKNFASESFDSLMTGISTLSALKASNAMKVSALPFVFYNSIVKEFMNDNLMQSNAHWFPENENHDMILPYDCAGAVTTSDYDNPYKPFVSGTSVEGWSDSDESYPWLNVLQNCMRRGDYFTTGSPFPDLLRGEVPTLEVVSDSYAIDFTNSFLESTAVPGGVATQFSASSSDTGFPAGANKIWLGTTSNNVNARKNAIAALNSAVISGSPAKIALSDFRRFIVTTAFRERMARCDGTYNQMIKQMFGHNPRWHEHKPEYCGSSVQNIVFSEVLQTSESSGSSPLGTQAGRAVSAQQSKNIHIHSDDFGMYMAVLVIMPEEYYSQGVNKMFSRLSQQEQYFPIMNNLSADFVSNKEIYVSGNNATDDDIFNYQERFAYYKSTRNRMSGLMAQPISVVGDIGAYAMNHLYGSTPNFNTDFVKGDIPSDSNLARVWASLNQAQYVANIAIRERFVGPLPSVQKPADFGLSY